MINKPITKSNIYGLVALFVLIFYTLGLSMFLFDSHKEIKDIYKQIDLQKKEVQSISMAIQRLRYKKDIDVYSLDLDTDESIYKFVSSDVSFNNLGYIPADLVYFSSEYIADLKGGSQLVRSEANEALQKMGKAFYEEFNRKINIVSAYRSYNYQAGIKSRGCPDNLCAKAGYSEHQSGLAVDLWEATSERAFKSNSNYLGYFNWLNENAHEYGFTNTYQKGLDVDTYEIEPWHWRYIGVDIATYLHDNHITTAEFYKEK